MFPSLDGWKLIMMSCWDDPLVLLLVVVSWRITLVLFALISIFIILFMQNWGVLFLIGLNQIRSWQLKLLTALICNWCLRNDWINTLVRCNEMSFRVSHILWGKLVCGFASCQTMGFLIMVHSVGFPSQFPLNCIPSRIE